MIIGLAILINFVLIPFRAKIVFSLYLHFLFDVISFSLFLIQLFCIFEVLYQFANKEILSFIFNKYLRKVNFNRIIARTNTNKGRPSGRISDSGARDWDFDTYVCCCVLEQRHSYSPKSTGNTQEVVALSQHD